eukprot:scaffold3031_cov28-Tisochrysis_lutea.AAC.5
MVTPSPLGPTGPFLSLMARISNAAEIKISIARPPWPSARKCSAHRARTGRRSSGLREDFARVAAVSHSPRAWSSATATGPRPHAQSKATACGTRPRSSSFVAPRAAASARASPDTALAAMTPNSQSVSSARSPPSSRCAAILGAPAMSDSCAARRNGARAIAAAWSDKLEC